MSLIDENVHRKIEHTLLRTIISHLAIECNKVSNTPTDSEKDNKVYCTECPYFEYTNEDNSNYFYGSKYNIDNREAPPSYRAIESIKSLNDRCPLTKGSEEKE